MENDNEHQSDSQNEDYEDDDKREEEEVDDGDDQETVKDDYENESETVNRTDPILGPQNNTKAETSALLNGNGGNPSRSAGVNPITIINRTDLTRIENLSSFLDKLKKLLGEIQVIAATSGEAYARNIKLEQVFSKAIINDMEITLTLCEPYFDNKMKERNLSNWKDLYTSDIVELLIQQYSSQSKHTDVKLQFVSALRTFKFRVADVNVNSCMSDLQHLYNELYKIIGEDQTSNNPAFNTETQTALVEYLLKNSFDKNALTKHLAQQLSQKKKEFMVKINPFVEFKNALVKYIYDLSKSKTDLLNTNVYYISIKDDKYNDNKSKFNNDSNQNKNHGKHPREDTHANDSNKKIKVESSPCNYCGHSHPHANKNCLWYSHPNKNPNCKIAWGESVQGKNYMAKFNFNKLAKNKIDGNGTFDYEKAKKDTLARSQKIKGNINNNINIANINSIEVIASECNKCFCSCNASIIRPNKIQKITILPNPNHYLLSSIIKINEETFLSVASFIDTGTLGHGIETNFISGNIFDLIVKYNYININKIPQSSYKVCSDVVKNCIKIKYHLNINFIFQNELTLENEIINIPVFVIPNLGYEILIGRETILKYNILSKLVNHFSASCVRCQDDEVPSSSMSVGKNERHELVSAAAEFSDSVPMQNTQTRFGPIIRKSQLFDKEFEDVVDDGEDEYDSPSFSDTRIDETDLITYKGSESLQRKMRAMTKRNFIAWSTKLPTQPAKINPLILIVDKNKWCVRSNQGPPRTQGIEKNKEITKQLNELINCKVIRKSNAAFYSQIHMVAKPLLMGSPQPPRMCIDFRNMNACNINPSKGVIPNIQEMLRRIGDKRPRYFSKFDLFKGYWQCPMAEGSKESTAFVTHMGIFEWNRVPMGLVSAGGHFHYEIAHNVMRGLTYSILEVYIDDLFIPSPRLETEEEGEDNHIKETELVVQRAIKYGLVFNPKKTVLGDSQMEFTGHVCSEEGISFSREKLDLVQDFPFPEKYEDLKRFIGLANYFRTHIGEHSITAHSMNKLLANYDSKKKHKIDWQGAVVNDYNQLKDKIFNCPTLFYIKEGPQYRLVLETDASELKGLGGYLKQIELNHHNNIINEFPIAFVSKGWTHEKSWGVPDKEAYAIYYCIKKLEYILSDVHFIVKTDHRNITFINFENNPRVKRWKMYLQQFRWDVEYIKGKHNIVADALSRLPKACESIQTDYTFRLEDDFNNDIYIDINTAQRYSKNPKILHLNTTNLVYENNIICLDCSSNILRANPTSRTNHPIEDDSSDSDIEEEPNKARIPNSYIKDIKNIHNANCGHCSVEHAYQKLKNLNPDKWKYKQKRYIKSFIKQCPFCQKMRAIKQKILSSPFILSTYQLFERVAFDTIGPLPESVDGNKYIIVFICTFSRWIHLFAIKRLTAEEAAKTLIEYIGIYGCPKRWLSDRGTQFKNQIFKEVNRLMGIDHQFSTAYSSEENGIVERVNREILNQIRSFIYHKKFLYNWDKSDLPMTQRLCNAKVHSRTGVSPASLVMPAVNLNRNIIVNINGIDKRFDGQPNITSIQPIETIHFKSLAERIAYRYEELSALAKECLLVGDNNHINNYPTTTTTEFPANSYALLSFKGKDNANKFNTIHRGPLKVIAQEGLNTFKLQNLLNGKYESYNRQDLIPFHINIQHQNPKSVAESDKILLEIEKVIKHKPARPNKANELSFVVKWAGYDDEKDQTIESWKDNKTLHNNRVILRYLRDNGMQRFVPKNIEIDKDEFSSEEEN